MPEPDTDRIRQRIGTVARETNCSRVNAFDGGTFFVEY